MVAFWGLHLLFKTSIWYPFSNSILNENMICISGVHCHILILFTKNLSCLSPYNETAYPFILFNPISYQNHKFYFINQQFFYLVHYWFCIFIPHMTQAQCCLSFSPLTYFTEHNIQEVHQCYWSGWTSSFLNSWILHFISLCIQIIFLSHSSVQGQLGCFQFYAIEKILPQTKGCKHFSKLVVLYFSSKIFPKWNN